MFKRIMAKIKKQTIVEESLYFGERNSAERRNSPDGRDGNLLGPWNKYLQDERYIESIQH